MSGIRWLVIVRDPDRGSAPLLNAQGKEVEILAPDRKAAMRVATDRFRLPPSARVVSRLERDELRREASRKRPPVTAP